MNRQPTLAELIELQRDLSALAFKLPETQRDLLLRASSALYHCHAERERILLAMGAKT